MKRYALLAIPIGVAVIIVVLVSTMDRPSASDYRLARGRALLETENYLAALNALRDVPIDKSRGAEMHSYLGAAYLRLHLYKAAIREFEEAAKLRPDNSDPWIGLAAAYIEIGDVPKAIEEARRAVDRESRSPDAWIFLGRAQWMQREFDEAEKSALKAKEYDEQSPAVADLLLNIYMSQGDARKFQTELERTTKPTKPIQNLAVRFYLAQGQFARAYDVKIRHEREPLARSILETELALKREPERMGLYPSLIKNLVKIGRFADAITFGRTYKDDIPIDLEMGKAYWMTGQRDASIQAYTRASAAGVHKLSAEAALAAITGDVKHWQEAYRAERIEQDHFILAQLENELRSAQPLIRAFIYRYAGIYDPSFYNQAADEALHVLDSEPENFDALMTIVTAYHRLGRLQDAARYLETAVKAYPNHAEPLSRQANLALSDVEKDVSRIIGLMERAVRLDPSNAGYLYNLGWIYDQIGDVSQAMNYYQRAIRASPLSFEAMNNLGLLYGSRGEPNRALPLLQQAIQTDPENEAGYFNLAEHYVRRRDWKSALENYDRVLQINPSNAIAGVEKGKVLLELGRAEDAIEILNRALEVDANSHDAYTVLSSAYEKTGHPKESAAAAEEAERIGPRADAPK